MHRGGHPLHPALVHMPIGAWTAALVWDGASLRTGSPFWAGLAWWTIAFGLVAALPAIASGFMEYATIADDEPALRTAHRHMTAMGAAAALYLTSLLLRAPPAAAAEVDPAAVVCAVAGFLCLAVGGWYGGSLVYRHGVGRRETPPRS